jgi:peroxiredoxin
MSINRWLLLCVSCLGIAGCAKGGPRPEANGRKVDWLVQEGKIEQALELLDRMQFQALKAGRFQEDLALSLRIEELSQKTSARQSPWNCLKIAEAYLGLGDRVRGLAWLERSVYERDFMNLKVLAGPPFAALKDAPRYGALLAAAKAKIGLDQQARDFQVPLLDGATFRLSDQKGKVVLVDFWDVKCPPCRKEMPRLKEMFGEFRERGLVIIGISLDTDPKLLSDYLKEAAPSWPMACSFKGWDDETARLYRISATPSTWLIDRQGVLRHHNLRGEELRQAVRRLVEEK